MRGHRQLVGDERREAEALATPASPKPAPFTDAAEHLAWELERLELRLRRQVLRLRAQQVFVEDPFRGLYISDSQVDALLGSRQAAVGDEAVAVGTRSSGPSLEQLQREIEGLDRWGMQRLDAGRAAGIPLPLLQLAARFGLDGAESDVVVLALAPEIDRRWETLFAYVQNDVTRKRPTVGLALDLLSESLASRLPLRRVFTPRGRLLRHRLLRLVEDPQEREAPLPACYLRLEERVAAFLLGEGGSDAELAPFTTVERPAGAGHDGVLHAELRERLALAGRTLEGGGLLLLQGAAGAGKQSAAVELARGLGRPLISADLRLAADPASSLPTRLALLRREALLLGGVLFLRHLETLLPENGGASPAVLALARELESLEFPIVLGSERAWEPVGLWRRSAFTSLALSDPPLLERARLWREALAAAGGGAGERDVAEVAGKFLLGPGRIGDAARRAVDLARAQGADPRRLSGPDLHGGAKSQSTTGLARLAHRVTSCHQWSDLVVPRRLEQQLREIVASLRHRGQVHGAWGFEAKLGLGKGLNVLFAGPSGTGKTMAAAILAGELQLDLYRIDLATVVSKYIGETEKNLARVFDEAQSSNVVLFFDEADSLFGKRSEVKDAHDRYANLEIAYLLQRMEEYQGVSILATNLRKNLDDAFARRLSHTVEFPFPDAAYREKIWRRLCPEEAPLAGDVDFGFLARQFELTGGNIKNSLLAAAFLAATEGSPITMRHLTLGVARELAKLGKLPTKSDFGPYYELIREGGAP